MNGFKVYLAETSNQSAPFCPSKHTLIAQAILLLCTTSVPSLAQAADKAENEFLDDIPIVLSASRLSQPINEAPVAITIIDKQMIRDSGAWDLSELFRLVPGMYVAYHADPFFASDSTVAYHGLISASDRSATSNRMQVLIDGRSVYSIIYGGVTWSDLPITLQDIERIEVVRGPASAAYGANSFSSVINIITQHPAETQGKSISMSYGKSRSEAQFRQGGKYGDLLYRTTVSVRNDQGQDDDIVRPARYETGAPVWTKNKFDNKTIQQLNWRGDYQINQTDSLEMQAGYNGGPREVGTPSRLSAISKTARNHFQLLHWRRAMNDGSELSVKGYHTQERSFARLLDRRGVNFGDSRTTRYDLEVQHIFSPLKQVRMVSGGSIRYDSVNSPYYLGNSALQYRFGDHSFNLQRLFANIEYRPCATLELNIGGMLENNSYTDRDFTPRFGANWQFTPGHTFRIGYTEATRTPSVYEKLYEQFYRQPKYFPALPELRPERMYSSEIGYMVNIANINLDVRLFNEEAKELLGVGTRVTAINKNTFNSGSTITRGYETQLKWTISDKTRLIYSLSGGGVKSPNENGVIYSDVLPRTTQSLLVSHQFSPKWDASIAGYQVSKTHFNATDYNTTNNNGYYLPLTRRWDGRVAYQFAFMGKSAELALIAQNLANVRYFEYRYDNELPGRLTRLNLKMDF
jgi:iron complex outermembrane recepter protein